MSFQNQLRVCKGKTRILILTDITNEPDDSESLVRYLLYSNEFDTRGIVACTSTHMRKRLGLEEIERILSGYGEVVDNLNAHTHPDNPYPSVHSLRQMTASGPPVYGKLALEDSAPLSSGSELLISRVDESDQPLWVLLWGGANPLAQAISHVEKTRDAEAFALFRSKIRVYAISDQDDTGHWIRARFPDTFYICSVHGWCQYSCATWTGISGDTDPGGSDRSQFTEEWTKENIQIGPLGTKYPNPEWIYEGDTPTFLYLIQNGLGSPEHPHWGSWGGRYGPYDPSMNSNHFADACDTVVGLDGKEYTSNYATIWRWRRAFQNDFAARMQWTLTPDPSKANHAPVVIVNDSSSGHEPLFVEIEAGEKLVLDASKSYDPDGDEITFKWTQYKEPTNVYGLPPDFFPNLEFTTIDSELGNAKVQVQIPPPELSAQDEMSGQAIARGHEYHIILEVEDNGSPSLRTYKRVVVQVTNKALRGSRGFEVATNSDWIHLRVPRKQ